MGGGGHHHPTRKSGLENKEKYDFKPSSESDYGTHDTWDMRTPFSPFFWAKVRGSLRRPALARPPAPCC